jgi:hypothetical protein
LFDPILDHEFQLLLELFILPKVFFDDAREPFAVSVASQG